MFGFDHADDAGAELAKLQTSDISEADREWIFREDGAECLYSDR